MSSLIGFICLVFAIGINFYLLLSRYIFKFKNQRFNFFIRLSCLLTLLSFFSLMYAYVTSDFSNYNVFQNSHSDKPLIYKIAGSWGNHEGSILLWICVISLYCFLFSFEKNLDKDFKRFTLMIQNILFSFFAIFVM